MAPKVIELAGAEGTPASAAAGEASVSGAPPHDPSADYPSLPAADASAEAEPSHAGRIAAGAAVILCVPWKCAAGRPLLLVVMLHSAACCLELLRDYLLSCFCAARGSSCRGLCSVPG